MLILFLKAYGKSPHSTNREMKKIICVRNARWLGALAPRVRKVSLRLLGFNGGRKWVARPRREFAVIVLYMIVFERKHRIRYYN